MLILTCPYCDTTAEETEFTAGGEAHLKRVDASGSDDAFNTYLFSRKNPRGVHFERWRHAFGCGKWFHLARCTQTLEVFGAYPAQTGEIPQWIIDAVKSKRPDYEGPK